ncbi:hypothetical protein N9D66_00335 [Candidatus Nanopelagicales bacterium]|nr:hypothetical protein [Candidatus Nanopelagicales bacterium]
MRALRTVGVRLRGTSSRMKRLVMMAMAAIILAALGACSQEPLGEDPILESWKPSPIERKGLTTLASVAGGGADSRVALHTTHGDVDFWSGVNLGATTPGHSPGEVEISDEEYRRWIEQMGEMGVHFLRIYTIHKPGFYTELHTYNVANPEAPIYLVQGVYLPDESYVQTQDLWESGATKAFQEELRDASAAVSGDLTRAPAPGRASGTWTADVSPWLAAWIIGVEWDPEATHASDKKNAGAKDYQGKYFVSDGGKKPASATEQWIAARMDELATTEVTRGRSEPIAFANWPTTDPLQHPEEPLASEDLVGVDANHVLATSAWPGGTFASFHACPYYPDFLRHNADYQAFEVDGTLDPYAGYLDDLKKHFAVKDLPIMVTEFGVPSSIGSAHFGTNDRDQGQHSEQSALKQDAEMLYLFKRIGMSGGLLFNWADEWFKFTWNTLPRQSVVDSERRSLRHDPLTNEQWFGVLAQDPVRTGWRTIYEARAGIQSVAVDTDASFAYLDIHFDRPPRSPVRLEFDSAPGKASGAGYAVEVNPENDSARAYVRSEIDPIRMDGLDPKDLPQPDASGWDIQRMTVNRSFEIDGQVIPAEFIEVGNLVKGNWDPEATDYDSTATWSLERSDLKLRLPWSMLGLADPSSRTGVVPGADGIPVAVDVPDIPVTIDAGGEQVQVGEIRWEGWQEAKATERLKPGWQDLGVAMRATAE